MGQDDDEFDEDQALAEAEEEMRRLDEEALTAAGIAAENASLLERQRRFRQAADVVVEAWRPFAEVRRIAVIGSVAVPLRKEVPRFNPYRRARISLWHECKDLDLAVWLDALDGLDALRKARGRALNRARQSDPLFGVADHQVEAFLFEPGSDRHLGRLCAFNQCPKGKRDCLAPGCGKTPFLKQIAGFRLFADALVPERILLLFDRETGVLRRALDVPVVGIEEAGFE